MTKAQIFMLSCLTGAMSGEFNFGGGGPGGDLPPPFSSDPASQKSKNSNQHQHPARRLQPFRVGQQDVDPLAIPPGPGQGGMLVGPEHPGFWQDPEQQQPFSEPGSISFLPPGAVPSGARFDPITPVAPGSFGSSSAGSRGPVWPSGEPDPDAEPLTGPQVDPVHPGWRPPRGPPPGAGPFGGSSPPFFR